MRLALLVSSAVAFCAMPLAAQNFGGTWTIQGGNVPITLTLRQDGQGHLVGSLSGQAAFQIRAQARGQQFEGVASNAQGRLYIGGQLDPSSGAMQVVMAEMDAAGQAQAATARQLVAVRSGAVSSRAPAAGTPGSVQARGPAAAAGGGGIASTPRDRQIAQLLLRSAWCAFSYSQTSGTSHTERVVYRADGTGNQSTGGETYNSGPNGSVAGQSQGGTAFRWRVQNGVLLATSDGVQWGQYPLQITTNSSGYPIITAAGKEYSMCN